MRNLKPARHAHGPGTWWCYNNWDFNALGTLFERLTGRGAAIGQLLPEHAEQATTGVTVAGEMAGDTDAHQSRAEYRQA